MRCEYKCTPLVELYIVCWEETRTSENQGDSKKTLGIYKQGTEWQNLLLSLNKTLDKTTGGYLHVTSGETSDSEWAKNKVRDQSRVSTRGVTCTIIMGHTNVFNTKFRKFGTSAAEKMGKKRIRTKSRQEHNSQRCLGSGWKRIQDQEWRAV